MIAVGPSLQRIRVRVLHIAPALFGPRGIVGGAERYAYELARHMAEVVPTSLLTFGDETRREQAGSLRVRVLGRPWYVRGQRSNPVARGLFREILRADVVHCHQQHVLASTIAALTSRLTGRKVFVTDLGGGGWDVSAYLSTDRWYHGHLHISEYSRRIFRHEGKPWAHVILGGVDTDRFSPGPATSRRPVLFVGRLLSHKGVDDLLAGLPEGMELDVIGRPYDPAYAADLRRLAEGKKVTFREDCDDNALIAAFRGALCVVLPSVYRDRYGRETRVPELLGQTLLEGMACGMPAICTDVASMPEIVDDGVSGFVVPPNNPHALGEKLQWLADHPDEARRMGARARERVIEKFTWPQVVERCLAIYRATSPSS
jgi:glycosyltransferase involved in cell wall biosynthesis